MKKLTITHWIFIAMFAGIAFGVAYPEQARQLTPLSNIFLRLIKSIIAPLLFGTLVYGIAGGGHGKEMGRIGLKSILYFEVVTTIALVVGLLAVNIVQPGVGMKIEATDKPAVTATKMTFAGVLEHTFPTRIFDAMAKGEVLKIVGVS